MSAPCLAHELVLETPQQQPDGGGGFVDGWQVLGTVWAEITARTGRETQHVGAPVSRQGYRITVRGAPTGSPDRPRPQQRFRNGQRIYNILAVSERGSDARYLTCLVEEELVV